MTPMSRIIRITAGWLLIVLGLIGLVVPILQGLLFLAIGAALLAPSVPIFHRASVALRRRFPALRSPLKKLVGVPHRRRRPAPNNTPGPADSP
jgi:uncharacterized membrane protein YbaN (DUF454 family)